MQRTEFLRSFGDAIRRRRAAVFVGAGVSKNSGFPSWDELVTPLKHAADVPSSVQDPTLAAEYALQELDMNQVERLLLEELNGFAPTPNNVLDQLLSIDFAEIWTTNFDTLIEDTFQGIELVVKDDDYEHAKPSNGRRLTKLHGSLGTDQSGNVSWLDHPVITRSDFETFERDHPLKWAMLRAQFLTSSFLFLGFSFSDPNVGALLRIVRSLPPQIRRLPHFAVMKAPGEPEKRREFELFSRDLAASKVFVVEVGDYSEIPALLQGLARNALPPNLFIAGKADSGGEAATICTALGAALTGFSDELTLMSFDGSAARAVNSAYKTSLRPEKYQPERIRTYYRQSPEGNEEITVQRFGTAVFTEKNLEDMRAEVFTQVRVLVLIGTGNRAMEEAELALKNDIPVIPLAHSGETAHSIWERGAESCGFDHSDAAHEWSLLESGEPGISANAVTRLLRLVALH